MVQDTPPPPVARSPLGRGCHSSSPPPPASVVSRRHAVGGGVVRRATTQGGKPPRAHQPGAPLAWACRWLSPSVLPQEGEEHALSSRPQGGGASAGRCQSPGASDWTGSPHRRRSNSPLPTEVSGSLPLSSSDRLDPSGVGAWWGRPRLGWPVRLATLATHGRPAQARSAAPCNGRRRRACRAGQQGGRRAWPVGTLRRRLGRTREVW